MLTAEENEMLTRAWYWDAGWRTTAPILAPNRHHKRSFGGESGRVR